MCFNDLYMIVQHPDLGRTGFLATKTYRFTNGNAAVQCRPNSSTSRSARSMAFFSSTTSPDLIIACGISARRTCISHVRAGPRKCGLSAVLLAYSRASTKPVCAAS